MIEKKRNTKRKIRQSFDDYFKSIEDRIEKIRNSGDSGDRFDRIEGES